MNPSVLFLDLTDDQTAAAVCRLRHAAYSVEAALIEFPHLPPLRDTPEDLQTRTGEAYLGCTVAENLVAVLSYKIHDKTVEITGLTVSPEYFRQGYATSLLQALENLARNWKKQTILVSTASTNFPALSLYANHGFLKTGDHPLPEGLSLTTFEKLL